MEWVPDAENRFQITVEISGCLMNTIPRAISTVLDDIPKVFSLSGEDIHRRDVPMVPQNVIREAIVNALMHRNYRMRQPVQLIRYANRLEIRNPGFSLIPDERLGQPGSLTRNDKIAAALHEVGFAETKGSGIRSMRSGMEKAHLTPPIFESDRQKDAFTVTLLTHHLYGEEDVRWLGRFKEHNLSEDEAFALIYTKEVGFISNAIYRNINHVDSLTASSHLCRLRDVGLLVQDGKGSATSYRLPETLYSEKPSGQQIMLGPLNMELSHGSKDSGDNNLSPKHYLGRKGLSPESNLGDKLSKPALKELSQELESQVKQLGQRATPADVMLVIEKLCNWMPLQGIEIAAFIERDHDYVRKNYLGPMIRADRLRYLYPEHPNRPDQAYIGPESIEVK
jgi:ATP-dependent DNA helicase RecG